MNWLPLNSLTTWLIDWQPKLVLEIWWLVSTLLIGWKAALLTEWQADWLTERLVYLDSYGCIDTRMTQKKLLRTFLMWHFLSFIPFKMISTKHFHSSLHCFSLWYPHTSTIRLQQNSLIYCLPLHEAGNLRNRCKLNTHRPLPSGSFTNTTRLVRQDDPPKTGPAHTFGYIIMARLYLNAIPKLGCSCSSAFFSKVGVCFMLLAVETIITVTKTSFLQKFSTLDLALTTLKTIRTSRHQINWIF